MTRKELSEAWPDFIGAHFCSKTELAQIASRSANVEQANAIWANEDWWTDESAKLNGPAGWPGHDGPT